LNSYL
jgi:glycylpeptide N-tetradecanoyltransferase